MNQENDNIKFRIPSTPNNIVFTMDHSRTEVMRITKDGLFVNPDMQTDDVAKAVLDAIDKNIKFLVQKAVEDEREACAKLVEADGLARGDEGLVFIKAAERIRARGEM